MWAYCKCFLVLTHSLLYQDLLDSLDFFLPNWARHFHLQNTQTDGRHQCYEDKQLHLWSFNSYEMHFTGPDQNVFIHWTLSDWLARGALHYFSRANALSIESSRPSSVLKMNGSLPAGFTDISWSAAELIITMMIRNGGLKCFCTHISGEASSIPFF